MLTKRGRAQEEGGPGCRPSTGEGRVAEADDDVGVEMCGCLWTGVWTLEKGKLRKQMVTWMWTCLGWIHNYPLLERYAFSVFLCWPLPPNAQAHSHPQFDLRKKYCAACTSTFGLLFFILHVPLFSLPSSSSSLYF